MTFSRQLKAEAIRLDLTRAQLADLLGIPLRTLQDWIAGNTVPPAITQEGAIARLQARPSVAVSSPFTEQITTSGRSGPRKNKNMNTSEISTATLIDYKTGDMIRPATSAELAASIEAAKTDGGSGVIVVDGVSCYAQE